MAQFLIRRIATQNIEYAINVSIVDPSATGPFDPDNPAPTVDPVVEPGCEAIPYEGDVSILSEQPTPTSVLEWNGGPDPEWVERAGLHERRARKADEMSQACAEAIMAGFACDALGAGYFYPAKLTDQANLTGSVLRSMYSTNGPEWRTPFWCADADGAWEFRPHTAAQIQHVGDCAVVARLNCMGINEQLQAQIADATAEHLATIHWP